MKLRENVLISELTTMRLGGKARFVAEVENLQDLKEAYEFAKDSSLPVYILGDGANTIGRASCRSAYFGTISTGSSSAAAKAAAAGRTNAMIATPDFIRIA